MNERSTLIVSFIAATAIVFGAIAAGVYLLEPAVRPAAVRPTTTVTALGAAGYPATDLSSAENSRQQQAAIYRCDTRGLTTYSQRPCNDGKSKALEIGISQGFRPPPPPLETAVDRWPQSNVPAGNVEEAISQDHVVAASNEAQCKYIAEQLAAIDAQARQPQPISMQDFLRKQRADLMQQWADAKCQHPS